MSSIEEEVKHLQIPLQELSDATNGFSDGNLIAKGGFGKVYKGVSVKHGDIAIKLLDPQHGQGDNEFKMEIALLSVYKHENIVSLLGFCDEDGKKMLVYKFESKGSLDRHLNNADLTWIQRLQICLDAARGLQYLHDGVEPERRILHRDIKSSNILLGENWKAKISDFGLSRMGPANVEYTFLISNPCGTFGYIDPEYTTRGYLTQKSDVYSFGIVLFEVLCERLARIVKYKDERQFLSTLITINWKRNSLDKIINYDLRRQINTASLNTFSSIAYQCLMSGNERPTMKKVVEKLQKALENQLVPSISFDGDYAAHLRGQSSGYKRGRGGRRTPARLPDRPGFKNNLLQASSYLSSPASSSKLWKYDVFISFSGEDACKQFVDHLYSALEQKGIFTYKDDEQLPKGDSIGPSLLKAIEDSQIAIVVFSRNYASSSWCLNELEFIMENKDKTGQIVIPIFYDVEPKEVRKQTGYYGEAFSQHELENMNKVESWRKALVKAGNLSGWPLDGHEAKFIKDICNSISQKLLESMTRAEANADQVSSNIDQLIGLTNRMQELKSFLKVGSGDVQMVGICGMWGSGKSTLASFLYEKLSHEFEGCCFVDNVRAESRMHGLKTLQEKILSNVLKSNVTLMSIEQGIKMMERILCRNSVLLVLDDVDHSDHLKMLAGSKTWFGGGSRIIFTTRNQDLVNAHGDITHNVRMLEDMEAIELFSRHALENSKPAQGFLDVSLNMVSKLGGHPSVLIRLGSYLRGKDMSEWMSILNRLEAISVAETLSKYVMMEWRGIFLTGYLFEGTGVVSLQSLRFHVIFMLFSLSFFFVTCFVVV